MKTKSNLYYGLFFSFVALVQFGVGLWAFATTMAYGLTVFILLSAGVCYFMATSYLNSYKEQINDL